MCIWVMLIEWTTLIEEETKTNRNDLTEAESQDTEPSEVFPQKEEW